MFKQIYEKLFKKKEKPVSHLSLRMLDDGRYNVFPEEGETVEEAMAMANLLNSKLDKKRVYDDSETINVEQFTELFHYGEQKQGEFRNKLDLPYIQITPKGQITYNVGAVREWFKKYEIRRKI